MTQSPSASEARLCRLQYEVGRVEPCPEERCPFWEAGGAVVGSGCAFDRVDVSGNTALAEWLLRIRKRLESLRMSEEDGEARRLFYRLLNSGKGD